MKCINIVTNLALNEYWIADLQYSDEIDFYINKLESLYGKESIQCCPTDDKHLNNDIEIEEKRGHKKSHYTDWITTGGNNYGNIQM